VKASVLTLALAAALVAGCGGGSTTTTTVEAVPDGYVTVKMNVLERGDQVLALVPVTINGKGPYTFALDTGASQSLVDDALAKELGAKKTGDSHPVAGITEVTNVQTIAVDRWSVGDVRLPPTTVVAANLPFGNADSGVQGLLGSDMLSAFDIVTIDYENEVLRLRKRHS
jgi:predicted aspartyl protease